MEYLDSFAGWKNLIVGQSSAFSAPTFSVHHSELVAHAEENLVKKIYNHLELEDYERNLQDIMISIN